MSSSTSSVAASSTSSSAAATSSTVTETLKAASNLKIVGIILAITSGLLIGSSFVFKKKGLLRSQAGGELGEGVAYLKSPLWWLGMTMMIVGEFCNFAAYAFVEAIVVTPLGALSVVICAILSSIFLNEKLSFFGWLGCGLCILGSIIIALNGPKEETVGQITAFQKLFLAPGFLVYISVMITASLVIVFYFAPKYGKKSMLWYLSVCSMIGGISVSVTTGLGAAIVQTAMGDNQFKFWFMYFLFGFVIITLLVEVYYLNVALAMFNTAMVTPTYYVIFTFCSMVTTIVLFQGLEASVSQILTIVLAFLVICLGITILQMSKVDPEKLSKLDRRSTMLLQVARQRTERADEKGLTGFEDPGIDTLRGSFGTVGSIIRARTMRRMSQMSHRTDSQLRMRPPGAAPPAPYHQATTSTTSWVSPLPDGLQRHQLYDAPVPKDDAASIRSHLVQKRPTIKFGEDVVHSYNSPRKGDPSTPHAHHEHRQAAGASILINDGYPPLPPLPPPSNRATVSSEQDVNNISLNLLELDSPEMGRNVTKSRLSSERPEVAVSEQIVDLPPLQGGERTPQSSTPLAIYQRFARAPGAVPSPRKDSRDVFDSSPGNGSRGTLLSFPSVTDSAPSEWGDEESKRRELELEKEREKGRQRDKSKLREKERERAGRRYPRGAGEDDDEESERLWRKAGGSMDAGSTEAGSTENSEDGLLPPPPDGGGIRLVQSGSRNPL